MTYGIEAFGSDSGGEFLQLDSDLGLEWYIITELGTASSWTKTLGTDDLLFVKDPNPGNSNIICLSGSGNNFVEPDGTASGAAITVDYFIAEKAGSASVPAGASNYGLQVFDSGSNTIFDSRKVVENNGFLIVEYVVAGDVDGSAGIISSDESLYTEIGAWAQFNSSVAGEADYNGVEYRSTSIRHWWLESDEELGPIYFDNYTTILLGELYV